MTGNVREIGMAKVCVFVENRFWTKEERWRVREAHFLIPFLFEMEVLTLHVSVRNLESGQNFPVFPVHCFSPWHTISLALSSLQVCVVR